MLRDHIGIDSSAKTAKRIQPLTSAEAGAAMQQTRTEHLGGQTHNRCIQFDFGPTLWLPQVWESATAFADAYRLGQLESKSAMNLMNHVPETIVSELHRMVRTVSNTINYYRRVYIYGWLIDKSKHLAVVCHCVNCCTCQFLSAQHHQRLWSCRLITCCRRTYSMQKFLPHECLSGGAFNLGHCTVLPQHKVWEDELMNTEEVLQLLLMRLEKDYATLHVKARKPYASKDIEPCLSISLLFESVSQSVLNFALALVKEAMQRVCCLYLACERSLRSKVPEAFFLEQQPEIRKSLLSIFNSTFNQEMPLSLLARWMVHVTGSHAHNLEQ